MTDSMTLITAQISFLDSHLALIHIPIELYSAFLQPIFRLLFGEDHDEDAAKIPWTNRHDFLNITINSVECSIICLRSLADQLFVPLLQHYHTLLKGTVEVEIGYEEYMVIQVDGQGLDAGQRVLELTSPLAMAGISLFFITTYFCDYILVPSRARRTVTKALEQRGFVFSKTADAFVSQLSPSSPTLQHQHRSPATTSPSSHNGSMPSTPPAKDVSELQARTFTKLRKSKIAPLVDDSIRLVSCAGNRDPDPVVDEALKNDLLQILLSTTYDTLKPKPTVEKTTNGKSTLWSRRGMGLGLDGLRLRDEENGTGAPDFSTRFLSITITATEPISVFMEQRLVERFGMSLLGAKGDEDALSPITLDLRDLPMEATGIVCGVAGRLAQGCSGSGSKELGSEEGTREEGEAGPLDITFLSTAKAGTVLVKASELEWALGALEWGMREVAKEG